MGVYRMKVAGRRKPVLVRADSIAKARIAIADGDQMTAEEMEQALVGGEKVWTPGEAFGAGFPDDEPASANGDGGTDAE